MTLKEWLNLKGTSQADAAKALGVDRTTICHLVSGDKNPSLAMALRVQAYTGGAVTVEEWPPRRDGKHALKRARR